MRSIVDSLGVPAIQMDVVINAVQRIDDFNVPFFAIPHRWAATNRRMCARARLRRRSDRACREMRSRWEFVAQLNSGFQWRTK